MTQDVLFITEGHLGIITLNRPKALHALTLPMIMAIQEQLKLWEDDDRIHAIILRASPSNVFCAGGDIRWLYETGHKKPFECMQFFWHEYRLNHYIHHMKKPYIALMDGLTMGGGVGVAMHGSHAIATEDFVFAMPETGIGFFPDVGASHLLTQCPGRLGVFLGLTGNRLGAQDCLKSGLVDKVIPSESLPVLIKSLVQEDLSQDTHKRVDECVARFVAPGVEEEHSMIHSLIDPCFSYDSVEEVVESLKQTDGPWAAGVAHQLEQKSPLSLKVTLTQLRRAKGLSLASCVKIDYNLVGHFMQDHDFFEGVRALIIDKDKNPKWDPSDLEAVSDEMVLRYFERFDGGLELV